MRRTRGSLLLAGLALAGLLAGCTAAAAPAPSPSAEPSTWPGSEGEDGYWINDPLLDMNARALCPDLPAEHYDPATAPPTQVVGIFVCTSRPRGSDESARTITELTVREVPARLLGRALDALAAPDLEADDDQVIPCPAVAIFAPTFHLQLSDGSVVAVRPPETVCGFPYSAVPGSFGAKGRDYAIDLVYSARAKAWEPTPSIPPDLVSSDPLVAELRALDRQEGWSPVDDVRTRRLCPRADGATMAEAGIAPADVSEVILCTATAERRANGSLIVEERALRLDDASAARVLAAFALPEPESAATCVMYSAPLQISVTTSAGSSVVRAPEGMCGPSEAARAAVDAARGEDLVIIETRSRGTLPLWTVARA